MRRGHLLTILAAGVVAFLVLIGAGAGDQQAASGTNKGSPENAPSYELNWYSINEGGGIVASLPGYELGLTVGQPAAGKTNSASFDLEIGFWHSGPPAGACDCGVWGDVTGDGKINPVDVVFMVNHVYKNIDQRVPYANCPREVGDVNCDTKVNPLDVVHYVNYVYKSITPWPCPDPCT